MDPVACVKAFMGAEIEERQELSEAYSEWTGKGGFPAVVEWTEGGRWWTGKVIKLSWESGEIRARTEIGHRHYIKQEMISVIK